MSELYEGHAKEIKELGQALEKIVLSAEEISSINKKNNESAKILNERLQETISNRVLAKYNPLKLDG